MQSPVVAQHIFVIGLDGARGRAVEEAQTPQMDAFFGQGVVTYQARTVLPTDSYAAWGSMLTGVGPEKHKASAQHPLTDDSSWPTWLARLGRYWHEPTTAVFCAWDPIVTHLLEPGGAMHHACAPDCALAPMAAAYISTIKPRLFFIHLDDQDAAGHRYGYASEAYLDHLTTMDNYVAMVLDAISDADLTDTSLTIILADHGGLGTRHGGDSPEEMTILWAARGPGIATGRIIDAPVNIADTAAVILTAAGVPLPDDWDAVVPEGVFTSA